MSSEQAAQHEVEGEKVGREKSPSFHILPNSETLHRVKDPLVIHRDKGKANSEADEAEEKASKKEKSPSFHILPNSETLHRVKDPIKLK